MLLSPFTDRHPPENIYFLIFVDNQQALSPIILKARIEVTVTAVYIHITQFEFYCETGEGKKLVHILKKRLL